MAVAIDGSLRDSLCQKYSIIQLTYKDDDLKALQQHVDNDLQEHPKWKPDWLTQSVLIRYLKAFITVEDAHQALIKYCEWRLEENVDDMRVDDPDIVREMKVQRVIIVRDQKDKCHRPIMIALPRNHDKTETNRESLKKSVIFALETLSSLCDVTIIDNFNVLIDMNGFTLRNMDYEFLKVILWLLQNVYPETLGVCLVVNAPWIFWGCWQIIKYYLNAVTRSKILFMNSHAEMSDFVDVDSLPVSFFGNSFQKPENMGVQGGSGDIPSENGSIASTSTAGSAENDVNPENKTKKKKKKKKSQKE